MDEKYITFKLLVCRSIAALRRSRNIHQRDVAKVIGIAQASYSRREMGRSHYSIVNLMSITKLFEIDVPHFFLMVQAIEKELKKINVYIEDEDKIKDKKQLGFEQLDNLIGVFLMTRDINTTHPT